MWQNGCCWRLLALPLAELAVFIAVAAAIGFAWALTLVLATSLAGALVLRHAGGNHIARVRVALDEGSFTALQADSSGGLILLAGILLLIPGFITDIVGLLLLIAPLRRAFRGNWTRPAPRAATAWSIWRPSSGAACPTRRCPTGATKVWGGADR